jgi:hypothetical protein
MTKPMIRIHDVQNDEIIDREMNDAEFAIFEAEQIAIANKALEVSAQLQAKQKILDRLGITADEAALLLK